jgi:hypothetical protein
MYSISKKLARTFICPPFHYLSEIQKVSKLHPIFSKSLKIVTMISAEASIAHHEQALHNITWEVKFQMLLEFQARNNHFKVTHKNVTQLIYSWVRNERQLYKKDIQSYDPLRYKKLIELAFQCSLNKKQTTFSDGLVFLTEFVKQYGNCVAPTHYPQNQQLAHWVKCLRRESHKLLTTWTSKVKLEKAMELAELGFYKKKNGFEGAQDVLEFYNKTFKETSPVESGNRGHPPSCKCRGSTSSGDGIFCCDRGY